MIGFLPDFLRRDMKLQKKYSDFALFNVATDSKLRSSNLCRKQAINEMALGQMKERVSELLG